MINEGANILVIASIDGTALAPILQTAADQGIKVIAYDRLINGTDNVDYYATFDNYQVGKFQGEYIETALDLKNQAGPFNIEPFAGSPDDNNAKFFFAGAWDVLLPYVEKGVLNGSVGQVPGERRRVAVHRYPGLDLRGRSERDDHASELLLRGRHQARRRAVAERLAGAGHRPGPRGRRLQPRVRTTRCSPARTATRRTC